MFHSRSVLRATTSCLALLTFLNIPSTFASTLVPGTLSQDSLQSPALRIVVLVGENAVNVIKKGTVVMPVVQVLDQSGKPVAERRLRSSPRQTAPACSLQMGQKLDDSDGRRGKGVAGRRRGPQRGGV